MFSSLDSYSHKEDASAFPGKRALISFLSWFDYCDQLIKEAQKVWNVFRWYKYIQQISSSSYFLASEFETHHFVLLFQTTAVAMAKAVRERFFIDVMEPQLMQTWVASYKTQQNRIWIKLIFWGQKSVPHLIWKYFVQFRDRNPHIDCTIAPHCSSGDFGCPAAGTGVFYTWRAQRARNTDRHQQASTATQIDRALWSHFWWGEKRSDTGMSAGQFWSVESLQRHCWEDFSYLCHVTFFAKKENSDSQLYKFPLENEVKLFSPLSIFLFTFDKDSLVNLRAHYAYPVRLARL